MKEGFLSVTSYISVPRSTVIDFVSCASTISSPALLIAQILKIPNPVFTLAGLPSPTNERLGSSVQVVSVLAVDALYTL